MESKKIFTLNKYYEIIMKYQFTESMREISGFGGGYENACRKMVVTGLEWLDKNPEAVIDFKQYENIYGITTGETPDCEKMQKVMNESIDNEASGAMMQACLNHVMFIKKNGWDKYVSEMIEVKSSK